MVILFPLLPSGEQMRGLQGKERGEGKQGNPSMGSREEREWQRTWELSCQQKSDVLPCSEDRRQVFPNPGAPTWLWKPHPWAHRQPTLLWNLWDTLGSCSSFWRHVSKSCPLSLVDAWNPSERRPQSCHPELKPPPLFKAKLIAEILFSILF